ncbi:MAG: bifunctional diaminohydroxyphosphoribosylaminopyrimidine deaminase/5-amino-6-(5-phosphoribosylamino)uracil reductase RibD [Flavobacteriales bacterium]|nr:bifunctional diaminohydroxyphosphoribosylaminopyrimidine deaminase/5-amino-6-(5-phosphoribosylamino)uracil reductase RibD [Flavobacteriales bacterium]
MPNTQEDQKYMLRCLELAELGKQFVSPNPMVGAVLVYNNRIIGEGYHQKFGAAHAEVNAINSVSEEDQHLINSSTLYVSLEPCSHHGKTPPCSDLIVRSNIPRVVIGCIDTYSEVAGRGIEKLKTNGVDVSVGIMENEARYLNRRFFTFHEKMRPYIILKWAQSKDGFIDKIREKQTPHINWITEAETQQLTHHWRAEEDAILVGHQTVLNDNPSLTVRSAYGKNPVRIVLSGDSANFPKNTNLIHGDAPTYFFDPRTNSLEEIMNELYKKNIQSLIVEGGKKTLETFLSQGLWDEVRILKGALEFKEGIKAPEVEGILKNQFNFGNDFIELIVND